jgi:hypothetical protein
MRGSAIATVSVSYPPNVRSVLVARNSGRRAQVLWWSISIDNEKYLALQVYTYIRRYNIY